MLEKKLIVSWRRKRRQAGPRMRGPETRRMRRVYRAAHAPLGEAAHVRPRAGPHAALPSYNLCERARVSSCEYSCSWARAGNGRTVPVLSRVTCAGPSTKPRMSK